MNRFKVLPDDLDAHARSLDGLAEAIKGLVSGGDSTPGQDAFGFIGQVFATASQAISGTGDATTNVGRCGPGLRPRLRRDRPRQLRPVGRSPALMDFVADNVTSTDGAGHVDTVRKLTQLPISEMRQHKASAVGWKPSGVSQTRSAA